MRALNEARAVVTSESKQTRKRWWILLSHSSVTYALFFEEKKLARALPRTEKSLVRELGKIPRLFTGLVGNRCYPLLFSYISFSNVFFFFRRTRTNEKSSVKIEKSRGQNKSGGLQHAPDYGITVPFLFFLRGENRYGSVVLFFPSPLRFLFFCSLSLSLFASGCDINVGHVFTRVAIVQCIGNSRAPSKNWSLSLSL